MRASRGVADRAWIPLVVVLAAALAAPAAAGAAGTGKYIVTLKAKPLASYAGGVSGIPATSPRRTGQRLSTTSAAARAYRSYLAGRQAKVLARLSRTPSVIAEYRTALAGFAAELTAAEAARLRKAPEVRMVEKDRLWQPTSYADDDMLGGDFGDGAAYLNLSDPGANGLWDRFGGPRRANGAGSGVIVGVLDTGIQPNHPSFASSSAGGYVGDPFAPPPGSRWNGACQNGSDASFPTTACNGKLIGARYFLDGFGAANLAADSKRSPADDDGHGTHTSSTAAGNFGVNPQIDGNELGVDVISGIAPRSWVAMYKVCWEGNQTSSPSGCSNLDSLDAIDAAIADGVDVINYSIGSSDSAVIGAVELAYLQAADAGVFVAVSAGNDGPDPGTVGSPAAVPWVTAAAASTLHRTFSATAPINGPGANDFSIKGASVTNALSSSAQVVDAEGSGNAGVDAIDAARCTVGSLDPAKVTGKIVLCIRGDNARVQKSHVVAAAGGVGMILYNTSDAQETVTDTHWVPSVHVSNTQGLRVKAAIAAGTTTATIPAGTADTGQPAKVTAAFSSRGPQTAVPDIAKPDLTAPGVNILAGASSAPSTVTDLRPGQLFQSISGTSMSSPHVAGAGALLRQAYSRTSTSPAAIKSMLMTTANPATTKEDAVAPSDAFDTGSGEIDPNRAVDAGLVVDATTDDYLNYLDAVAPEFFSGPETQPKDLNLPSISISQLAGTDSVARTFTSLDSTPQTWSVAVTGLPGLAAAADVGSFTIAPGARRAVRVSFEVRSAPLDEYQFGALVLSNGARTVRLPISVKPVAIGAPRTVAVTTNQAAGAVGLAVKSGYAGSMSGLGLGLAPPQAHPGETISATDGNPDPTGAPGSGTKIYPLDVPAGAQLLASRITNVDGGDPNTDLDMYIYRDDDHSGDFTNDEIVAQSASGIALEKVSIHEPPAGHYGVAIVGFTTKTPNSVYDLTNWVVADPSPDDPAPAPGLTVTGDPASVIIGCTPALKLNWSGVGADGLYLGVVTYHNAATPTATNAKATSIVELTKSASAPPESSTPGGTPCATTSTTPGTPGTGTPPAGGTPSPVVTPTKLALKLRSARLVKGNRFLRLRLRTNKPIRVRAVVRRGTRTAARTTTKRVTAVTRTVRVDLRLTRHLRPGVYRVTVVGAAGKERAERRMTLRVRR